MPVMASDRDDSGDRPSHDELLSWFLEDLELQGLTHEGRRSYRSNARIFLGFLGNIGAHAFDVHVEELRQYLRYLQKDRKVRPPTIHSHFSTMSRLYAYLHLDGFVGENPIPAFRARYLRLITRRRHRQSNGTRQLISVERMANLINSITHPRDRAVLTLLAKTGIRRKELVDLDVGDVDWETQSIRLKPKAKRSRLLAFFDEECARVLARWMRVRDGYAKAGCEALFVGEQGGRLNENGVYNLVTKHAGRVGLHDASSESLRDHFSPHCCRHWFTTHLLRAGMPREYVKELRGDSRTEAVDLYHHIDDEELRRTYLACMPELGL